MLDKKLLEMPESINRDDYVIATYYIGVPIELDPIKYMAGIAVEQSTGTWTPVPAETEEVRERHLARMIGMWEVPGYQIQVPEDAKERHFILQLAFPVINFGPQFPMLFASVIGNISFIGKVKLMDLEFPKSFLKSFKGPKFGIEGIRKLLGVEKRPLLNNMIKPCAGLTPEKTAELAYEVAVGGVDIIKDDELIANPEYSPIEKRVKLVEEALKRADDIKGEKTIMVYNITDDVRKIKENALKAIDAGAQALMLNVAAVGYSATRMICEDPDITVPIMAHPDFVGVTFTNSWSGMSFKLAVGKLARLAGCDMIILPCPYGKFPLLDNTYIDTVYACYNDLPGIKRSFPAPSGGAYQGTIGLMMEQLGNDIIIALGGAIHGHPMGATAGAKACRQAIDAIMAGKDLREAAQEYEELKVAIDKWGIAGDKELQKQIFDVKVVK